MGIRSFSQRLGNDRKQIRRGSIYIIDVKVEINMHAKLRSKYQTPNRESHCGPIVPLVRKDKQSE